MNDILSERQGHLYLMTLNRVEKNNAFDDSMLQHLKQLFEEASKDQDIRLILIKANGPHFSAGADLAWMKRMATYSEEKNIADANLLASVMYAIHHSAKPTLAMVQGAAMGGGAGIVAACDIAIAAEDASFGFTEVKLGLIPAVISPFVIKAIGPRAANALFISAERFDAQRALALQLIHHCVPRENLLAFTLEYAQKITSNAPQATHDCKRMVQDVYQHPISLDLMQQLAEKIAKKRVSQEGQTGLHAFLNKDKPAW